MPARYTNQSEIQTPSADRFAGELILYGEITNRLATLQRIDCALAAATSVQQVKNIHDVAVAMAAYARQASDHEREADSAEIRMKAVSCLGEVMQAQRATSGLARAQQSAKGFKKNPLGPPTLAEAGIGKGLAHQARSFAKMLELDFEQVLKDKREIVGKKKPKAKMVTSPISRGRTISAQPKRATHLDLLELWMLLPVAERRHFLDGIGLRAVLGSIPETWIDALARWLEDHQHWQQSPPITGANIPADLSIPQYLRQSARIGG